MKKNYYIYCLKLDRSLLNAVAEQMGMMVYHKVGEFHTRFDPREADKYEPLRDVQKQMVITYMLNREFSVANFTNQGVIIDHFPMHHFTLRGRIEKDFRKYFWTIILSSFIFQKGKHENSLRSITNVAFYLGI